MGQRRACTDVAQNILGEPLKTDHATGEHLLWCIVKPDETRSNPLGKKIFGLPQSSRELDAGFRSVRRDLAHPCELDAELIAEALECVDVDPTQCVEFLDRRRVGTQHLARTLLCLLAEATHDGSEQFVLGTDQPKHRAVTDTRCGGNVAKRRAFITSTPELRPSHGTD